MDDDRSLGHECGIFAMEGDADAARLTYLGLHALQHRGHEAAGMVARDGETLRIHKGEGRVHEVFDDAALRSLPGDGAMGHVRYATAGGGGLVNAQPFLVTTRDGSIALAHNGNLTNARALRAEMEARGAVFTSTSDTEVILHLFAASEQKTTINRLVDALRQLEGAFCLLMFVGRRLIAVRDPWGFRPLVLGRRGDTWIVASETCAVDFVRGEVVREIEPGEMLVIEDGAVESLQTFFFLDERSELFLSFSFFRSSSSLSRHGNFKTKETKPLTIAHAESMTWETDTSASGPAAAAAASASSPPEGRSNSTTSGRSISITCVQ